MPAIDPNELLIRNLVDYAIYMADLDGRVVSWNPGAERIKGCGAEEIIGQHFSCFYTAEDRAAGLPTEALNKVSRQRSGESAKAAAASGQRS